MGNLLVHSDKVGITMENQSAMNLSELHTLMGEVGNAFNISVYIVEVLYPTAVDTQGE